ncbi:MAG: addiction module protein [Chitinophagaceae bacterium]|nr:addiction module protein [Chitinophagaceae bacterium]
MPYNKEELLALSPQEKVALAEELWSSVEEELMPITDEDVAFAEERLKMHQANPNEGVSIEEFKSHFSKKYGF